MAVYEIVCKHNIELLDEADELAEKDKADKLESTPESTPQNKKPIEDITLDLVSEMVEWDRRKRILEDWKWKVMDDVTKGRKPLTDRYKYTFYLNLELLRKKDYQIWLFVEKSGERAADSLTDIIGFSGAFALGRTSPNQFVRIGTYKLECYF